MRMPLGVEGVPSAGGDEPRPAVDTEGAALPARHSVLGVVAQRGPQACVHHTPALRTVAQAVVQHRLEYGASASRFSGLGETLPGLAEVLDGKHDVNHALSAGRGRPPARSSHGATWPDRPVARYPYAAVREAGERASGRAPL
jgi:hypothetical protein